MGLVERLMKDPSVPEDTHIAVHVFFAGCQEIISGRLTQAQVQNYLVMSADDLVDWNKLVALFPTGTTATAVANKALFLGGLHAAFILAENRAPGYDTPAAVRAKLGIA